MYDDETDGFKRGHVLEFHKKNLGEDVYVVECEAGQRQEVHLFNKKRRPNFVLDEI